MNASRRQTLERINIRRQELHANLEALRDELTSVQEEEQEAFDNMPESLQDGERGQKAQEGLDQLDNAMEQFGDALDALEQLADSIEEAQA